MILVLSHAVRLLTLTIALLSMLVTLHFLEARRGWWNKALLFVSHLICMNTVVFIGEVLPALLTVLVFIGSVLLFCQGRVLARLSLGIILGLIPLAFSAFLTNIPLPGGWGFDVVKIILWGMILVFVKKSVPSAEKPPIRSTKLWALMDFLAIAPFGAVFAVLGCTEIERTFPDAQVPFEDYLAIPNLRVLLIILALAVLAAIGLLVAVVVIARYEKLELEQVLWQGREQHYRNLEQTQFQMRRLRHDMANHLTAMAGLDDSGMRTYLDELISSPAIKTGGRLCENEVVGAVLASKIAMMEEAHIPFAVELDIPAKLSIANIDLCALFANSLDNAIEASLKVPVENRKINLIAKVGNGLLMVEMQNNSMGVPNIRDGKIITSKKDKWVHGLGLASIREVVNRYGGICTEDFADHVFCLHMTIPLNARN